MNLLYLLLILTFSLVTSSKTYCTTQLFFNGKIISSLEESIAPSEWMVLRDGRVFSLGKGAFPELFYDTRTDLYGRFVLPSLTDSHAHIAETGQDKFQVDLRGCKSQEEVITRLKSFIISQKIDKTSTIMGSNWDQSDWPGKKFPHHSLLDLVSETQMIILSRVDGHALWVNDLTLKKAKISQLTTSPKGGKIERDKKNNPTGILIDEAMDLIQPLIQADSKQTLERAISETVEEALSLGITGIHDAGANHEQIEAIRQLLAKGKIHFRFYEMLSTKDNATLIKYLKRGPEIDSENGQLTLRTVKLFADGAMGSRGAAFDAPYSDDPKNVGLLILSEKEMTEQMKRIDKAGFQIAIHAIGSKANRLALNAFEKVLGSHIKVKRPRLEHAQVLEEKEIERIGRLGVIASMQPTHCTSDMKWVIDRIGTKRARYAYAWKSLLNAKAVLAFGSDSPVEFLNPWHGLYAATTRQDKDQQPEKVFFPEERITVKEAFKAFTLGAANSSFHESSLGDLTPGKWADFIVTKNNPLKVSPLELFGFEIDETYLGGLRVWKKDAN